MKEFSEGKTNKNNTAQPKTKQNHTVQFRFLYFSSAVKQCVLSSPSPKSMKKCYLNRILILFKFRILIDLHGDTSSSLYVQVKLPMNVQELEY